MDSGIFSIKCQARWADMDFNGHMKNTAYLDYAADSRMMYFKQNGFAMTDFTRLSIGPVVFCDQIQYFHELFMYETFTVSLRLKGISEDGAKFHFLNEIQKNNNTPIASITTEACWFDLNLRCITVPPDGLHEIVKKLKRADNFTKIISNNLK